MIIIRGKTIRCNVRKKKKKKKRKNKLEQEIKMVGRRQIFLMSMIGKVQILTDKEELITIKKS